MAKLNLVLFQIVILINQDRRSRLSLHGFSERYELEHVADNQVTPNDTLLTLISRLLPAIFQFLATPELSVNKL